MLQDGGAGIALRDAQRIFAPFERLDDRITAQASGSGLGLALSRDLARLHGGDLCLENCDQGARFVLTLRAEGES